MTVTLSREKHTVTNARRPVRSERSIQPMPVVAVTGAAGGIGYALTVRLAASPKVRRVIAIDGRRGDIAGVTWRVADVRDPAVAAGWPAWTWWCTPTWIWRRTLTPGSGGRSTCAAPRPCSPRPRRAGSAGWCC